MARVYSRPRYKLQARNKLIALAKATQSHHIVQDISAILSLSAETQESLLLDYDLLAELSMDITHEPEELPGLDTHLEQYLIDSSIGTAVNKPRLHMNPAAMNTMSDMLAVYHKQEVTEVLTDEDAIFYILHAAIIDDRRYSEDMASKAAFAASKAAIQVQSLGQKIAPAAINLALSGAGFSGSFDHDVTKYDAWALAAEDVQFRSQPMWVKYCRWNAMELNVKRAHIRDMVAKVSASDPDERFKIPGLNRVSESSVAYNYSGIIIIYHESRMLILDASAADYVRTCMTSLRNATMSFSMFRLTGDAEKYNILQDYKSALRIIAGMIKSKGDAAYVARHMHLCYTRWQNLVGEAESPIDCGHEERDPHLESECRAVHPKDDRWWNFVNGRKVPERIKAEFFKLYHLLPPPDIDPLLLHETFVERAGTENKCNTASITQFMKFCKAYDLTRYLSKNRRDPPMYSEAGYDATSQPWYKKSKHGSLTMPPEADWGRAQLHGAFPYDHSGDFHIFSAKDSTRVVAQLSKYMDRAESRDLSHEDQNELLSAIFRGATLSNGMTMAQWRDKVMTRDLDDGDHIIAAEAGKSENTKPGKKVRETLSACDIAREFLTEVDQSIRPLAAQTPGVSIRVDLVRHKRKFQSMAAQVAKDSPKNAFATSTDISGWSPKMPREMFHAWQEYALSTTECDNPKAVKKIWDRLRVFVDRRGIKASAPLTGGNVQGWPATSDTTMHAHILIYWAYKLRSKGILNKKELAYTLCLIDDAATVVVLDGAPEEAKEKAEAARKMLDSVYADLGFQMDGVKSFFSAIKFVYLNELYWDGAQVAHATKTMMRIDKDHTRRFASLPDKIAAAQGVAASAAAQGADPFVAYWMAAWMSYRWAYSVDRGLMDLPKDVQAMIMMAPVSMNGCGMRSLVAVFATGVLDQYTWYAEIFLQYCALVNSKESSAALSAILAQTPAHVSAQSVFMNPFGYTVDSHRSASVACKDKFRESARSRGLAEPFSSLDKVEISPEYVQSIAHVLSQGSYEAGLLEEVSANMPSSFVDEVMSRVDKSELIAAMIGSKGIGTLRRLVASCDQSNLAIITGVVRVDRGSSTAEADQLISKGSFAYIRDMRDRYHAASGYKVLNHTYPCPFSLWAFMGEVDLASERARTLTTASFDIRRLKKTAGSARPNLYDSKLHHIGYKGYRTAGSAIFDEARVSLYNPVRKKVAAGLAALRWAQDRGAHMGPLRDLFIYAWGGHFDIGLLDLPGRHIDASAKRISLRHSRANHIIMAFPNTQGAVMVDARAVTRAQANTHHMYDIMSAITVLRCAMLLEASVQIVRGETHFAYAFGYKPNSAAVLQVPDQPEGEANVEIIKQITPFALIDSPLKDSASVVTSSAQMGYVLREYLEAGTKAANAVLTQMIESGAMSEEALNEYSEQTERVRVTRTALTYGAAARGQVHLFLSDTRKQFASGVVRADDPKKSGPAPIAQTTAAMSVAGAAIATADAFASEKCRTVVNVDARFAYKLHELAKKSRAMEILDDPEWDKMSHKFTLTKMDILDLVRMARQISQGVQVPEALSQVFLGLHMPGFRSVLMRGGLVEELMTPDLLEHSAMSFCGRTDNNIGWLTKLGKTLGQLRHSSSQEYSDTQTSGENVPARAVAAVLKAQWRFASARYGLRADAIMDTGARGHDVVDLNSKAMFLNVAADVLRPTGNMSMVRLYQEFASRFAESAIRHLSGHDNGDADEFTNAMEVDDLDDVDDIETDVDCTRRIRAVAALANKHGGDMDGLVSSTAASRVVDWVKSDIGGHHKNVQLRSTGRHERLADADIQDRPDAPTPVAPFNPYNLPTTTPVASPGINVTPGLALTLPTAAPAAASGVIGGGGGIAIEGFGEFSGAIGGDDELDGELAAVEPSLVFQYMVDENTINNALAANKGYANIYDWYSKVTTTRAAWDAFLVEYAGGVDPIEAEDIDASIFPVVDFEADSGDWVNE
jgi:hypothetical protein